MAEFKVIETQEQLDSIITARLERDRKSYAKQFEADYKEKGWKSPEEIEALTKDLNDQIEELGTFLYSQYSEFRDWAKESKEAYQAFRDYFPDLLYNLYLKYFKELIRAKILGPNAYIRLLPKDRVRTSHITLSNKFQETIDTLTGFTILL